MPRAAKTASRPVSPSGRGRSLKRCAWASSADPLMQRYHDREWGTPVHDDRTLFEFLILEGMQAGLSWQTILRKREHFRAAFDRFDPRKVARDTSGDVQRLLRDPGIVRNRLKINAAITNARGVLAIQRECGSFDAYLWGFVNGRPIRRGRRALRDIPVTSKEAEALSRDLRRRGMTFVGPTIVYAFMQAVGMVNDHTVNCFRYRAR